MAKRVGVGVCRRRAGGVLTRLPALAPTLVPAESRAAGRLWQDSGKTVPATADGDPVRVATCLYTGRDWAAPSAASRPLLRDEGGGKWSLSFDGVDDYLSCATAPTPAAALSAFAAVIFADVSATRAVLGTSAASGGPFYHMRGAIDRKQYLFSDNVTALPSGTASLSAATWYRMGVTFASPALAYRLNGASDGTASQAAAFSGPGDQIGAVRGGTLMAGRLAAVVWGAAAWAAADVADLETYLRRLYP